MAKISLGSLLLISTIEHVLSRYACEVLVGQRPGKISRWARIFQITISSMVEKSRNPPFVAALLPKPDSPMKIEDALLGRRLIGALVELIRSDQSVYDVLCVLTNLVAGTSDTGSELLLESLGILEIYGMLENEKYRNDAKIGEQAFWLIGNIVRDSKRICQLCYRQGVHQALFTFFDRSLRSQNLPVLRKIVWSMNGLLHMHIEPIIETSMVERMVYPLGIFDDDELLTEICEMVRFWLRHEESRLDDKGPDFVVEHASRLMEISRSSSLKGASLAALKVIGELVSQDHVTGPIVALINMGLFDLLVHHLVRASVHPSLAWKRKSVPYDEVARKPRPIVDVLKGVEAGWILSNIVADCDICLRAVLDSNVLTILPCCFDRTDSLGVEAAWVVMKVLYKEAPEQICRELAQQIPMGWALASIRKHKVGVPDVLAMTAGAVGSISSPDFEIHGRPLIHLAVEANRVSMVQWLSTRTSKTVDAKGRSCLFLAASKGFTECLKIMLDAGIKEDGYFGHSALAAGVAGNHTECVRLLIRYEASHFNFPLVFTNSPLAKYVSGAETWSPLIRAVDARDYDLALAALQNGAKLETGLDVELDRAQHSVYELESVEQVVGSDQVLIEFKSQPKLLFNSLGMMTSPDPALWDTVFLTPVKVVGPTEIRFKMHWSRPDLHQHESPSIDVTSSLWPTGYEDVPQTAMVVASSDRYPTARPCEPRIIELLELASGVWTHESDFTYSKLSRQVVRVVVEELQHHRPLAGSSLPGQDDLWNIILEYAIGRD